MALYYTLFSQLDVTSAELFVTDNDFRDPAFRKQLIETVMSLLSLKVVPIFNENDAVTTRKAPFEDSSRIFWDNDSLGALLALELTADLLVLLSDVDGLYSGPPSDPHSELIHTYIKKKLEGLITFGDKLRVRAPECSALGSISESVVALVTEKEKENICLYSFPNETAKVNLSVKEVPPELPEPGRGINFARDGMQEGGLGWLSLIALHSDSWLLVVSYYFGARFGFGKSERYLWISKPCSCRCQASRMTTLFSCRTCLF